MILLWKCVIVHNCWTCFLIMKKNNVLFNPKSKSSDELYRLPIKSFMLAVAYHGCMQAGLEIFAGHWLSSIIIWDHLINCKFFAITHVFLTLVPSSGLPHDNLCSLQPVISRVEEVKWSPSTVLPLITHIMWKWNVHILSQCGRCMRVGEGGGGLRGSVYMEGLHWWS